VRSRPADLDDATSPARAAHALADGSAAQEDLDVHNVSLLRPHALLDILSLREHEVAGLHLLVAFVSHWEEVEPTWVGERGRVVKWSLV
jgi:hypothetical protein